MKLNSILLAVTTATVCSLIACTDNEKAVTDAEDQSKQSSGQTICPVSGEELGSMGEPIVMTHEGKEVKLCCKSCIKQFKADPEKYMNMVY